MSNDDNKKSKVWKSSYDPEAERCCYKCYKTLKAKEGILESKYDFICPPCHKWKRQINIGLTVGGIVVGLALIGGVVCWLLKRDKD